MLSPFLVSHSLSSLVQALYASAAVASPFAEHLLPNLVVSLKGTLLCGGSAASASELPVVEGLLDWTRAEGGGGGGGADATADLHVNCPS